MRNQSNAIMDATQEALSFAKAYNNRANRIIEIFLMGYFVLGLLLSMRYNTWLVAISVGGLCLFIYYVSKGLFPNTKINQYVASAVVGVFTAQYIYQMHGLFEMHFFAFIGSALMIVYQNWKVIIPVTLVIAIHHGIFAFMQIQYGYDNVYFSQVEFDLEAYAFHIGLAVIIFFICALWSYEFEKQNLKNQNMGVIENMNNLVFKNVEFAANLAQGNYDVDFKSEKGDIMGETLLEIRNKMKGIKN